jgi:NADH:ubiquinone oxidoreductase subunit K
MRRARPWVTGLAFILAALHLAAAGAKLLDLRGFAAVLADYRMVPAALLLPLAIAVVVLEVAIGVGLLLRNWRRPAALTAAALAGLYAVVLSATLARGIPLSNCGCFGVYLARPLTVFSPLEDVALLLAGLLVARRSA